MQAPRPLAFSMATVVATGPWIRSESDKSAFARSLAKLIGCARDHIEARHVVAARRWRVRVEVDAANFASFSRRSDHEWKYCNRCVGQNLGRLVHLLALPERRHSQG